MGFMDKLKAAKNFVTGGAADVQVEVFEPSLDEPFTVKVTASTKDSDVNVKSVYLKIRGREYIEVPDYDITYDIDGESRSRTEIVRKESNTLELDIEVAGPQTLEKGQTYEWEGEVQMPDDANPTYEGNFANHVYEIQAGLDTPGNDPDSGWSVVEIY